MHRYRISDYGQTRPWSVLILAKVLDSVLLKAEVSR